MTHLICAKTFCNLLNAADKVLMGAALGRRAMLVNQLEWAKPFNPHPTDIRCIAASDGHEITLVGETGWLEGNPHSQEEHVTEADMAVRHEA